MKRQRSVKTEISLAIALSVLITVIVLSLLINFFLDQEFVGYITQQQQMKKESIVGAIQEEYVEQNASQMRQRRHGMGHEDDNNWNITNISSIGSAALSDGLLVHVRDDDDATVWSAQQYSSSKCHQVVKDIDTRMESRLKKTDGQWTQEVYSLVDQNSQIGTVEIGYYGPYFLSVSDFQFLDSLNRIIFIVGGVALLVAIIIGLLFAQSLSRPIHTTAMVASQMAAGDYKARITENHTAREVNDLIRSINHLGDSLEQQEILRKNLTADVAHELRTPLTTVSTHIEAMMEGVWEPTPERLGSLYEETHRITGLVKDLEDLARVENDTMQLRKEPIDLWQIIDGALENFDYELADKQIVVSKTGARVIAAVDKDRFYQVIYNLLSNSLKFTPNGGNIYFSVDEVDQYARIIIRDTGIGISSEELPYVFERFYRAEKSRNRNTGGSGIGLAIIKSVVERHGGHVSVQSTLGEGSQFIVTIPKE